MRDHICEQIAERLLESLASLVLLHGFLLIHCVIHLHDMVMAIRLHEDSNRMNVCHRLKASDRIATHVQDTVATLLSDHSHTVDAGSIEIILELAGFNEQIVLYVVLHLGFAHKVVISAVDFMLTWRSGRVRNTAAEAIWISRYQLVIDSVFQRSENDHWTNVVH